MASTKRTGMRMTSVMLSDEDRALVRRLTLVVAATAGVTTLAAVIRYALRRAAELEATKRIAGHAKRRAKRKPAPVSRARLNASDRRTTKKAA